MIGMYFISAIMIITACLTAAFYVNEKRNLAAVTKIVSSLGFMLIGFIMLSKNFGNLVNLKYGIVMLTGLIMCFVGDIFLLMKELFDDARISNMYLVLGVLSFAFAQILFAIMFIKYSPSFKFYLLPLTLVSPILLIVAHKIKIIRFDKRAVVMIIYSLLINFTTVCALNLAITAPSKLSATLIVAMILFMCSDSALCYTYYGRSVTLRRILNYAVMICYYITTILLAYSIMLV